MQTVRPTTVAFGSDRRTSVRFAGLALAISALLFVAIALLGTEDGPFLWFGTGYNFLFLYGMLLVLAGGCAYRGGGLLASVLLAFAPIFVVLFQGIGAGFASGPVTPLRLAITAVSGGAFYGLPVGVLGFLFGVVARRIT